jgi:hypothetical protein
LTGGLRAQDVGSSLVRNVVYRWFAGAGVRVRDIAFVSETKAYLARAGSDTLAVFNPSTGAVSGAIGLESLESHPVPAPITSDPCLRTAAVDKERAYVACQTGQPASPAVTGCLVVISTVNDSIEGAVALRLGPPRCLAIHGTHAYVACSGLEDGAQVGGIEMIDLESESTWTVVSGSAVGGDIGQLEILSAAKGYFSLRHVQPPAAAWSEIIEFAPSSGAILGGVTGIEDGGGGMVFSGRYLYVGERGVSGQGVAVVDPLTNAKIGGPYDVGMPPGGIALIKD